ncbi:hypothetical protein F5148DRAFT_1346527 [Russula earlei]|uniref:Uncharacterized protein n=1 Tax=Russula earlei TaxID=71964 RepID=A0ACC0UE97_9AGAM|nr:hypothetical protein F5148DRAFT_1346527 [Russula earlei]
MSATGVQLDPYLAKAQNDNVTPSQKIEGTYPLPGAQTGMLTTRAQDGHLHSRAMTPAGREPFLAYRSQPTKSTSSSSPTTASPKFKELQNDSHANVSFFDTSTTNWASFSGIARVIDDRSVIKKYWSSCIGPYFGDLGDGIHKGDENDPRVAAIEVIPDEVRYWLATSGEISSGVQEVASRTQGTVAVTGELRTITKQEIQLVQGLGAKLT